MLFNILTKILSKFTERFELGAVQNCVLFVVVLQNEYHDSITKVGFDVAENEPSGVSYEGLTPGNFSAWIPDVQPRFFSVCFLFCCFSGLLHLETRSPLTPLSTHSQPHPDNNPATYRSPKLLFIVSVLLTLAKRRKWTFRGLEVT